MKQRHEKISKFLSYVLRHHPESIGLELDEAGWASVDELLQRAREAGRDFNVHQLSEVVRTSPKRRFSLSRDRSRVRANYGHSIPVDLGLAQQPPPARLYHGTATRFLDKIMQRGLQPRKRQYVHLSRDRATAIQVGQRHGRPVVLEVDAQRMATDGHAFYRSGKGIWLTDAVPARYLRAVPSRHAPPPTWR